MQDEESVGLRFYELIFSVFWRKNPSKTEHVPHKYQNEIKFNI